jgi:predicted cobalt transporter CbtA
MSEPTWGRRLGNGGLAGLGGGLVSAFLLWLLVGPAINRAIAIEEAGTAASDGRMHDHGGAASAHEHAEVVTRIQQQIGGALTAAVVAVLFGLAYAVVYARSRHRLPGTSDLGRSLSLAALAFAVLAVVPAVVMPANPPAVGDPDTVNERTLTYLLAILLSVLAVGVLFAADNVMATKGVTAEGRWAATAAMAAVAFGLMVFVVPEVSQEIPSAVPADLIWEFRVGSLAQLGGMWAGIGVIHGVLAHRGARRPVPVGQGAHI